MKRNLTILIVIQILLFILLFSILLCINYSKPPPFIQKKGNINIQRTKHMDPNTKYIIIHLSPQIVITTTETMNNNQKTIDEVQIFVTQKGPINAF